MITRLPHLITLVILLLAVSCGGKSEKKPQTTSLSMLTVSIPSVEGAVADTMYFGDMREGEIISSSFTLHNKSTEPIVIIDIETACGCTETKFDTTPILAGQSRDVAFTFNSSGRPGWQILNFKVILSDGSQTKIYFEAIVN